MVTLSNIGDVAMTTPVFEPLYQVYLKALIDIVGPDSRLGHLVAALSVSTLTLFWPGAPDQTAASRGVQILLY